MSLGKIVGGGHGHGGDSGMRLKFLTLALTRSRIFDSFFLHEASSDARLWVIVEGVWTKGMAKVS